MSPEEQIKELQEIQEKTDPVAFDRIMIMVRDFAQSFPRREVPKLRLVAISRLASRN